MTVPHLLRPRLANRDLSTVEEVRAAGHGAFVRTAGLVICRQRPGASPSIVQSPIA